jgi:hypothetical protein
MARALRHQRRTDALRQQHAGVVMRTRWHRLSSLRDEVGEREDGGETHGG